MLAICCMSPESEKLDAKTTKIQLWTRNTQSECHSKEQKAT